MGYSISSGLSGCCRLSHWPPLGSGDGDRARVGLLGGGLSGVSVLCVSDVCGAGQPGYGIQTAASSARRPVQYSSVRLRGHGGGGGSGESHRPITAA